MNADRLKTLRGHLERIQMVADADVVRHDKGPEHEPGPELMRALSLTTSCAEALKAVEAEEFEQRGDIAWLNVF